MIERNHIINLSTYEKPCIEESRTKEWVDYLMKLPNGRTEEHYDWLIDRYRYSATNNAVISNMARLIYGKGLDAYNANRKPSEYAQMLSLLDKKVLRKVVLDLKMLGGCAFQVIYDKKHTKIVRVDHFPMNLMRPNKCNDKGEIEGYWFCDDWSDTRKYEPEFYPTMGTSKKEIEVLVVQPYAVGMKYFSEVDYFGALPYCVLEEEIADYLINDCQNGFAPTTIVNYNNDDPDEETRERITKNTIAKTTGSKGKRTIVSFNANKELATTVETIPLNDAPEHYQYLADEARNKILASHGVVSPMLVGIVTDSQGFNSNADEIEVASKYFYNTTINHFQELIIDALDKILAFNKISLDLYFEPVGLLDRNVRDRSIKAETPLTLSKHDSEMSNAFIQFADEDMEGWELIDSARVDYDSEEQEDAYLESLNKEYNTGLSKLKRYITSLVSTGTARPNASSEQDGTLFKHRYRYNGSIEPNSREFCKKMVQADKVYRKEDIINMGSQAVNAGWGPEGADTYSIWLYKGGGACGHYWTRETYLRKSDANSPLARKYTPAEVRKAGELVPLTDKDKDGKATNDMRVYTKPKDMPYEGFLPTNKRFN